MDPTDADQNAINGNASAADYDQITQGTYTQQQDPYSAADNGTMNNGTVGAGNAAPTAAPAANQSIGTPPSWLQTLNGIAAQGSQLYTQVAPIVGGKPAASPGQAGAVPAPGAKTIRAGSSLTSSTVWLILAGIAALFFFLRPKRR